MMPRDVKDGKSFAYVRAPRKDLSVSYRTCSIMSNDIITCQQTDMPLRGMRMIF